MKLSYERVEQIIQTCLDNNIKAKDISENTDVPKSTVYRILSRNTKDPSHESLLQIEEFLREACPDAFDEHGNIIIDNPLDYNEDLVAILRFIESKSDSEIDEASRKELIRVYEKMASDIFNLKNQLSQLSEKNEKLQGLYNLIKSEMSSF